MIPAFSVSGVLPPFQGDNPAQPSGLSPYPTDMMEIATRFAVSDERREILSGLLRFRRALRDAGFRDCVQWLDGSFCEDVEVTRGRPPADIDVVTIFRRPPDVDDIDAFMDQRVDLFDPTQLKDAYHVDGYYIDLDTHPIFVVNNTVYWYGLFSHQRATNLWKGMLQIELGDQQADNHVAMIL